MAVEVKEFKSCIIGVLMQSIRLGYTCARDHPSVPAMVLFLFTLYSSFPSLFAFLVSCSPVILCTALLLGLLLIYGEPNLPEARHDTKSREISSLKVGSAADDLVVENDKSIAVAARVKEAIFEEEEEEEEEEREKHNEEELTVERETQNQGLVEEGESSVAEVGEDVCGVSSGDQMENKGLTVEIGTPALDSSLGSPWHPIDVHDAASYSETDGAESSSTDASMADIIPMLEELHPLLDSEAPRTALESMDHELDGGNAEEEAEHQEDEEDAEVQGEKDDGNGEAVKWTADDQKNLMDLGTSEVERNRRLENLIAKRRARKNPRFAAEKNLIDLDSTLEELYGFHVQIPPISAASRNPFDLPCDSEEIMGFPQVPSSAPSVLLHGRNPFDLPSDELDQRESFIHQEFVSAPQRDLFPQRHEDFSSGASFSGELQLESDLANLQRELSEKIDSKVSLVLESDPTSSIIDQKNHKELLEEEMHEETGLLSPSDHDAQPIEQEIQSSEQVDSVDVDHEECEINAGDDRVIDFNTPMVTEETHQAAKDAFRSAEEIEELDISDAANVEATEQIYDVDSNLLSRAEVSVDDSHVDGPIYDSDPSMIEDSLPNISTLDEALFHAGKGGLNSAVPLASDVQGDISEMDSPPRPLEKEISSGESVNETTGEDLVSASERIWVSSSDLSSLDEGESKSGDITQFKELDVIQVPEDSASEKTHPSTEKTAIQPFDEGGLEKSQISILNLPSIPEENLEDSKLEEEHESMIDPAGIVGSTGLHMIEEHDVDLSDTEHELSFFQRKVEEDTENSDDDSVISPIISSHDSGFAGLRLFELRESMESSSPIDTNEVQSHSDGKPNEIHAEVGSVEGIDEGLLSELDAVGDFRAEELNLDQGSPEMEQESNDEFVNDGVDPSTFPGKPDFPTQLHVSEAGFIEDTMLPYETNFLESEVGSSSQPSGEDPEMTVYNPKLHVLEACSFEELESAFKKLRGESVLLSDPEPIVEKPVTAKTDVGPDECNLADSELLVLEAKSIEDIKAAFKQLSKEGHDEFLFPEVEPSENLAANLEPMGSHSAMQIVEANSLEDIRLALKLLSDGSTENQPKSLEPGDGSSVVEASEDI